MQKCENLVDLEKSEKMRLLSLSEASIQPRTSLSKFEGMGYRPRHPPVMGQPAQFSHRSGRAEIRSLSSRLCVYSDVSIAFIHRLCVNGDIAWPVLRIMFIIFVNPSSVCEIKSPSHISTTAVARAPTWCVQVFGWFC